MTSKRFLFWIWISWGSIVSVYSQPLSPKIENLVKEVTSFTYSNKHDSAQALILNYLQGTELSDIELFYGHYLFANVLKSSGNPDRAIRRFQWCKNLSERKSVV